VLGHSAAGLALLTAGLTEPAGLLAAHRWPRPVYRAGPEAAGLGATAMIDISDGLVADLGHVAQASGVGISIDTARLVPGPDLFAAAAALAPAGHPGRVTGGAPAGEATGDALAGEVTAGGSALAPPLSWMLTGGEDHALAAAFPPGIPLPAGWTALGRVHAGHGVTVDGRPWPGRAGWDHYR